LKGRIVPRVRCSLTNFLSTPSSVWLSGISLPGSAAGAPGLRSIVWSHGLNGGNSWDASSEKTLSNALYCCGIWVLESAVRMYSRPIHSAGDSLGMLVVLGRKRAFAASGVQNMMGNWEWSIHPLLQSICGCIAANHGYPRMALFLPKFERKNRRLIRLLPV
jgi:hypothetical protein